MNLKKHIIDTIKEWQLKIGYREGIMKLYYPGESLVSLLGISEISATESSVAEALKQFCEEVESLLGRIKISGSFERYCLEIPAKGCAYVAGKVPEPEFLKLFLERITNHGSTMMQIRECFAAYAEQHGTDYIEEMIEEHEAFEEEQASQEIRSVENAGQGEGHAGCAFYFKDDSVEEYVYWVEENEFGLTYHRFTKADYERLK